MASVGEEEVEYESDPEEAKRSLAMRRREASDDEGEEAGRENQRTDRRELIHSDDSDSEGGVAADDYDEGLDDEEEDEDAYEEELEENDETVVEVKEGEGRNEEREDVGEGSLVAANKLGSDGGGDEEELGEGDEGEEEKKENEPFAVPKAGAFYMHDDRFGDNARGRNRRTFGGRQLWESKDDRKWGHDKFEEMSTHERNHEEGRRNSKGHYRGRGRNRGADHGYNRGNRSKAFNDNNNINNNNNDNTLNQPKSVRGRGPRRYEPSVRNNNQAPSSKSKQSGKLLEKSSHSSSGRVFTSTSNTESDLAPANRPVLASSLNYASPPFYPSGASSRDVNLNQKKDVPARNSNKNLHQSVADDSFSMPQQPHTSVRGKNVVDSAGFGKFIDDSVNSASGKSLNNMQMLPSGLPCGNGAQFPQTRSHGRGTTVPGQMIYQPTSHSQVSRASPSAHAGQRGPMQGRALPVQQSIQSSAQMLDQRLGSESQASSPPKTSQSANSFEPGETESGSESSKSKNQLVKGKANIQGNGIGSFIYNGAQVMGASGNMGVGPGNQNFPGTPAFLPVMQFGGQHPGGIGVPAVGMAFPGYVAQSQLGIGNSEMTWLPVLAGAAGALRASYCPPYIAVDGSYNARPSGAPTSSTSSSSKDNNTGKPNNEWKSSQKQEIVSDEFGQRQNKARRYSEMSFSQ